MKLVVKVNEFVDIEDASKIILLNSFPFMMVLRKSSPANYKTNTWVSFNSVVFLQHSMYIYKQLLQTNNIALEVILIVFDWS